MKKEIHNLRPISLMYHDVVRPEEHQQSGFPTADAALYKLAPDQFDAHLSRINSVIGQKPVVVSDLLANRFPASAKPWMLTFDDGGASFHSPIAETLETIGWQGHFFITTDFIDTPGFLTQNQIRDLHRRGHLIGSHSCSHPLRFAARPRQELKREWRESVMKLSEILGEPVQIASIPGGQYGRQVAETAAEAGIKALFTSEPTTHLFVIDGCLVIGRYAIQRWMSPEIAAAMASGQFGPRFKQWIWWEVKKLTKALGGEYYLKLRQSWTNG